MEFKLFETLVRIARLRWQEVFRRPSVIKGLCSKVSLIIFDSLSKEWCVAAHRFCRKLVHLVRKSGLLHTALYLKQCSMSLQVAYGSVTTPPTPQQLPVPISLTRTGYPRIIPSYHRRMIRKRDDKADRLVQMYLSFFAFSKIIVAAKAISKKTFESITTPTDLGSVQDAVNPIKDKIDLLTNRYLPMIRKIPLHQGMKWVPTWKSLPSDRLVK